MDHGGIDHGLSHIYAEPCISCREVQEDNKKYAARLYSA